MASRGSKISVDQSMVMLNGGQCVVVFGHVLCAGRVCVVMSLQICISILQGIISIIMAALFGWLCTYCR